MISAALLLIISSFKNDLVKLAKCSAVLWVLICTVHLIVCSYHVTYAFQSEPTQYSVDDMIRSVYMTWQEYTVRIYFFFFSIQNIKGNCFIIFLRCFPIIFFWWKMYSFSYIFIYKRFNFCYSFSMFSDFFMI